MVNAIRFSNVAHIIVPSRNLQGTIAQEKALAPHQDNRVWEKQFPYDHRYGEAVMLSGNDLRDAGDTSGWDFERALQFLNTRFRSSFDSCDKPLNGTTLLMGRTHGQGRGAKYLHAPEKYQG